MNFASILYAVSLFAGLIIGAKKNQFLPAFVLCILMGPIGLLITLILPAKPKPVEIKTE